jgi:hypothetical protein
MYINKVTFEDNIYFFVCPHCGCGVIVLKKDVRCGIFRHGIYNKNNKQIKPHLPKEQCDKLRKSGNVTGCCKPFRLLPKKLKVEICDYI